MNNKYLRKPSLWLNNLKLGDSYGDIIQKSVNRKWKWSHFKWSVEY